MIVLLSSFAATYRRALGDYLTRRDEAALQEAYELGRAAMNSGLGIVELVSVHHGALGELEPREGGGPGGCPAAILEPFLLEALSPFEAAYRGFRGAQERLQQINGVLAECNAELALSNAHLEEEIRGRQRVEGDLRVSKDHYYQLFQQAHGMQRDLRELSARVLSAQEEERKRISRELHDEIGQALSAVNIAITMLRKQAGPGRDSERRFAAAEQLLAQSMDKVHSFARELRPAILDDLGLHAALRAHVATFARRTGIRADLVAHPVLESLDPAKGEVLFRVAQEALNNVFKHAKATAVRIEFTFACGALGMEVSDNGCAFRVEEKLHSGPSGRLGLLGMQERVRLANGTFAVESRPGRGTCVRVRIPVVAPSGRLAPGAFLEAPSLAPSLSRHHEDHIRAAC